MINIEEEIKILESTADNAAKDFQKEVSEKKRLEAENVKLAEDRALLLKRIEAEQVSILFISISAEKFSVHLCIPEFCLKFHPKLMYYIITDKYIQF
jgi:hypothetical protein